MGRHFPSWIVSRIATDGNIPDGHCCGEAVGIESYRLKPTENQKITGSRADRCAADAREALLVSSIIRSGRSPMGRMRICTLRLSVSGWIDSELPSLPLNGPRDFSLPASSQHSEISSNTSSRTEAQSPHKKMSLDPIIGISRHPRMKNHFDNVLI
jgi:hypothetical protein